MPEIRRLVAERAIRIVTGESEPNAGITDVVEKLTQSGVRERIVGRDKGMLTLHGQATTVTRGKFLRENDAYQSGALTVGP